MSLNTNIFAKNVRGYFFVDMILFDVSLFYIYSILYETKGKFGAHPHTKRALDDIMSNMEPGFELTNENLWDVLHTASLSREEIDYFKEFDDEYVDLKHKPIRYQMMDVISDREFLSKGSINDNIVLVVRNDVERALLDFHLPEHMNGVVRIMDYEEFKFDMSERLIEDFNIDITVSGRTVVDDIVGLVSKIRNTPVAINLPMLPMNVYSSSEVKKMKDNHNIIINYIINQ